MFRFLIQSQEHVQRKLWQGLLSLVLPLIIWFYWIVLQQKTVLFDDVYYRIFIKEGKTNVVVFDWTKTDVTNENSFYLDTSYLIPREYYMEFKSKTYTEEVFYNNYVKFEILSER